MTEKYRISPFLISRDDVRFKVEQRRTNPVQYGGWLWDEVEGADYFMNVIDAEVAVKKLANPKWYLHEHPYQYYDSKGERIG